MKKYLFTGILVIALCITGGFLSILEAAEIVHIEGKVEVQPSVEKAWMRAAVGMQVDIGDSIRTARRSRADIILDKDKQHVIRIEEQTMVVLNSTSPGQINRLDLSEGKIYADVEQMVSGLDFEITTPSGVAGVRGTGVSVDSNSARDIIAAYKDSVFVKAYDANKNLISELIVTEGFKTVVERFEAAGALMELTPQEMQEGRRVLERLISAFGEGLVDALNDAQAPVELIEWITKGTKEQIEEKGTEGGVDKHECEEDGW